MFSQLGAWCFIAAIGRAAQPSAPSPITAPLRELPWGQLNFLHSTDSHGWHAGHLKEPSFSADWGDYISFATRLRERADSDGSDLLLIDTGDRIEGNGLYDSSDPKGKYTRKIFKHQHIDIITIGNHELYKSNSSTNEYDFMVPSYKNNYISSNLDYIRPDTGEQVALAPRFKKFSTKNQGIRILAFGFIFDFKRNADNTVVIPVEETIKQQWFQDAIRDQEVDLIVVAGHVPVRSPEFTAIYDEIRSVRWDTPIQFFGGHTHIRDYKKYDNKAFALESGRYMETIGFQSITGLSTGKHSRVQNSPSFSRLYIDNNLYSFHHHSGKDETTFPTELGQNVTEEIRLAREKLGLDTSFGCAPKNLWTNRVPYPHNDSIYTWLDSEVVPDAIMDPERSSTPRIIIGNTGAIRFDIFEGLFTVDTTYTIMPFTGGFRFIADVPYTIADRVLSVLNSQGSIFEARGLEEFRLISPEQISIRSNFHSSKTPLHHSGRGSGLQTVLGGEDLREVPGYTTKDDAGIDGDDTIHSPIQRYPVPNCWETRVNITESTGETAALAEKVDLVYMDFIEPWILGALAFLGGTFKQNDTSPYMGGTEFLTILEDWIKENWPQKC